jgi:hypothetical protein
VKLATLEINLKMSAESLKIKKSFSFVFDFADAKCFLQLLEDSGGNCATLNLWK